MITRDAGTCVEFTATCIDGADVACGDHFTALDDGAAMDKWICEHAQKTGHRTFRRTLVDVAVVTPPSGAVIAGEVERQPHALDAGPATPGAPR
ncbi:hypothetical protein LRS74_23040 [Streptomyces sp. LX-29]|uniref:DUF7848 domain-containing protein n=1 Tax=Streptomyces sp. LX-29 TaxID=2900152 RepID=UPI00240E46A1|nr:hypothetical protein [Streptomyces sp. LX-29]WFB09598.1 hypothetical protein LRS74_23040 [Streptomyces sp. LX-29]